MREGRPSRTALATACARAYHQIADEPRIFTDPLAVAITGVSLDEITERETAGTGPTADPTWPRRRRMVLAARARFAEDTIADAAAEGTRQVVVLGAGLDTFAYRNPHPDVRVYEVDDPDTQDWKRHRLEAAGIAIPPSLTFVPVDFENQTLGEALAGTDFDRRQPAVFVWLGVVMYLTMDAIRETLRFVAGQATPVRVVFDYLSPPPRSDDAREASFEERARRVAAVGEPWRTFFTVEEITRELREIGFDTVHDHAGSTLTADYLGIPPREPANGGAPHIVLARRD